MLSVGTVQPAGTFAIDVFDEYDPAVTDTYPVITCQASNCNGFGSFSTVDTFVGAARFDLVRSFDGWTLQVIEDKHVADESGNIGHGFAIDVDWGVVGETVAAPGSPGLHNGILSEARESAGEPEGSWMGTPILRKGPYFT